MNTNYKQAVLDEIERRLHGLRFERFWLKAAQKFIDNHTYTNCARRRFMADVSPGDQMIFTWLEARNGEYVLSVLPKDYTFQAGEADFPRRMVLISRNGENIVSSRENGPRQGRYIFLLGENPVEKLIGAEIRFLIDNLF